MTAFSDRYRVDHKAEEEGVWVDFGGGVKVKGRRFTSQHARKIRQRLEKPYRALIRAESLPDEQLREINLRHIAEAIVVDWEGVDHPHQNGADAVPAWTVDDRLAVLHEHNDFVDDIIRAFNTPEAFRPVGDQAARKN